MCPRRFLAAEPEPQIQPVIAELLRTCVRPPSILLRVERVILPDRSRQSPDHAHETQTGSDPNPHRLLLTDGHLTIQAILYHFPPAPLVTQKTFEDSLIQLNKFKVVKANRVNGEGQLVYLAIEALEVVRATTATTSTTTATPPRLATTTGLDGGFLRDEDDNMQSASLTEQAAVDDLPADRGWRSTSLLNAGRSGATPPSSQDSDDFESAQVDLESAEQIRLALRSIKRGANAVPETLPGVDADQPASLSDKFSHQINHSLAPTTQGHDQTSRPSESIQNVNHIANDPAQPPCPPSRDPLPPPTPSPAPLHTLASLIQPPTPLPSRNYTCTILAVISWLSPSVIQRANSPFPPKRHLKIHDPSISARHTGITVAVYVDARTFRPRPGTLALFRGLTMQRWQGDVILNAYAGLKDSRDKWFVDDPDQLRNQGYDVDGLRAWWEARKSQRGS